MKNTGTLKVTTPGDREIVMTRVFDAPRHLVFDAFTTPDLLKRWFGPRGWSLVVCEVDLKVGGGFRFVLRGPDGTDMGMRGVYREIVRPERLAYNHDSDIEDDPDRFFVTVTFAEVERKTMVTMQLILKSAEIREKVVKFGAVEGGNQTLDRLREYLKTI